MESQILVAEPDRLRYASIERVLQRQSISCVQVKSLKALMAKLKGGSFNAILCSSDLGKKDILDVLKEYRKHSILMPLIVLAETDSTRKAVRSIKMGAFDYLSRPFRSEELVSIVEEALAAVKPKKKASTKKEVVGQSQVAKSIQKHIGLIAPTEMSVIIQGDTGTGKEFVAQEIFRKSRRRRKPFIALDCGAIPKELAGSELFGHKKGSFTGAIDDKKGSFELANRGTLFLDEIGNLSYQNQIRLLRVLQENKIKPIGHTKYLQVDVRVLAATNEDLWTMVEDGKFREDLYHRLNEFKIELPNLSERGDDIVLFAEHFLKQANERLNKEVKGFTKNTVQTLMNHEWTGNLRELKNVIKRACLVCNSTKIKEEHLTIERSFHEGDTSSLKLNEVVKKAEIEAIEKAMRIADGNKSQASKLLGIDRKTLYNKLSDYKL